MANRLLALPATAVVLGDLHQFARLDVGHLILEREQFHREHRPPTDRRELRADHVRCLRDDHRANGPARRARHHHRRHRRVSLRVRHGARRNASHAAHLARGGAVATVGELPRQGLRLDLHPGEGRRTELDLLQTRAARSQPRLHERRDVDRVLLHLAPVHDRADLRIPRENPDVTARRLGRPRWVVVEDVPTGHSAARAAGTARGIDLHVLLDARRLRDAAVDRRIELDVDR